MLESAMVFSKNLLTALKKHHFYHYYTTHEYFNLHRYIMNRYNVTFMLHITLTNPDLIKRAWKCNSPYEHHPRPLLMGPGSQMLWPRESITHGHQAEWRAPIRQKSGIQARQQDVLKWNTYIWTQHIWRALYSWFTGTCSTKMIVRPSIKQTFIWMAG